MSTDITDKQDSFVSAAERKAAASDLIALLHSWSECDEENAHEQSETFARLRKGIDEARTPYRTLFDGDRS